VISHSKVHSVCALYRPGEWLWVDSNGTSGKATFRRRANCHDFPLFVIISKKSRPEVGSRWRNLFAQKLTFFGKKTPCGHIFINVFRKDLWRHRSMSCVRISWKLAHLKSVKSRVAHQTKKNKISAGAPALASARIAPKTGQGQLQTIYSECPKFHPNQFTFSRVTAERVNVVETRHKVFPILGEATPSSPSKYMSCIYLKITLKQLQISAINYRYL